MPDLHIAVDGIELSASWTDENPETRAALSEVLPVEGDATRWGDELYFGVPIDVEAENAREEVPAGAVAYWPGGNAICLFWGATPASQSDEPRAAAPVNVIAMIENPELLGDIDGGARVRIEQA
ncbi:MAG: cyclophilin-like family protein [Salinirussus sp.]